MDRYRAEWAIRHARLPGRAKLILLVLLSRHNPRTGAIPDRYQPTIAELATETQSGVSTVKRYLDVLERSGWLTRARPDGHRRNTAYALTCPIEPWSPAGVIHNGPTMGHDRPTMGHDRPTMGQQGAHNGPPPPYFSTNRKTNPARTRERARGAPHDRTPAEAITDAMRREDS